MGNKYYFADKPSNSNGLRGVRVTNWHRLGDKVAQEEEYLRRYIYTSIVVRGSSGGRGLAWERGGAGGEHVPEDWKGSDRDEDGMAADAGRAERLSQLGEMGEDGRGVEDA